MKNRLIHVIMIMVFAVFFINVAFASKGNLPEILVSRDDLLTGTGKGYYYLKRIKKENGKWICEADPIKFYKGKQAVEEARKRKKAILGIDDSGKKQYYVLNDYFIINDKKETKRIPIDSSAIVEVIDPASNDVQPKKSTLGMISKLKNLTGYLFVLTMENGVITQISQQYLP